VILHLPFYNHPNTTLAIQTALQNSDPYKLAFSTLLPTSSNQIFRPLLKLSCNAHPILTACTAPLNFIGNPLLSKHASVHSFASLINASLNLP